MPEFAKEKEIFFEHLRRAGFKKTTQRELILEVFLKTEGHLSAEDLYNIVKVEDPTVCFTTVYRTLKLLAECGRLIEFYSEEIENKQDEIAAQHNFRPTRHSLRIWGVCSDCQARSKTSRR